jgi:hypothetical protein
MNTLHQNRVAVTAEAVQVAEVVKVESNVVGVLMGAKTLEEPEEDDTRIQMDKN